MGPQLSLENREVDMQRICATFACGTPSRKKKEKDGRTHSGGKYCDRCHKLRSRARMAGANPNDFSRKELEFLFWKDGWIREEGLITKTSQKKG